MTHFRIAAAALLLAASSIAQDWPNWRGPNHDGSSPVTGLPTDFSQEKHVRWKLDLPGPGASTPIVLGDRVFLTSVDSKRERLVAMCVDRKSGEIAWQKDAGSGFIPDGMGTRTARGNRTTYASPSAISDGESFVAFFFGNGDLVAYDLEGEEIWRRNVQEDYGVFSFQWTFSATPTYWDGRIYLPVLQRDIPAHKPKKRGGGRRRRGPSDEVEQESKLEPIESYLLGIDPKSGKTIYRHVRPSPAKMESRESYTTLIPWVDGDGRKQLLLAGGDVLTGHDPKTGEEHWRWGTWNEGHRQVWWRIVPTVVHGDGVALVCAPKRAPVYAVKLGGEGDLGEDALLWKSSGRPNPVSSDVPTPAYHDGHFYVLSDVRNALSKVRAKDGEVVWKTDMLADYLWRASPTVADGRVFCMNHNGEVAVLDQKDGKILHEVRMSTEDDDHNRSSIVAAHGALFVRTNTSLFCIGK